MARREALLRPRPLPFHTRFSNRILPDYLVDPDLIVYDNLNGFGSPKGSAPTPRRGWGKNLRLMASNVDGRIRRRISPMAFRSGQDAYFAPDWSGTFTVSLALPKRWSIDLAGQCYGPMRLPVLPNDFGSDRSPTYAIVNLQVKRPIGEHSELYGGV
ncbi:MAG: hypothetical protein IPO90_13890 [Flavobacteriales bacterium]|nr:hypothetical protein [Flavobacteriales bacterium]